MLARVKVARSATELLAAELAGLTPDEWESPEACGAWTVAETAAHLARAGETYAGWVRRSLQGTSSPPEGVVFITDLATGSASVQARSVEFRRLLGDGVLAAFERNSLALVELFESLKPSDWRRRTFHPGGVIALKQLLGWRVAELSLHRWDLLNCLGREASLPDGSHEVIVDWLPLWLKIGFQAAAPLPEPRRFLFVLGSPLLRLMKIHIYGDRFVVDPPFDQSSADAVLTTDPETFILLMMGRRSWQAALKEGHVVVGGSRKAAAEFSRWFGAL